MPKPRSSSTVGTRRTRRAPAALPAWDARLHAGTVEHYLDPELYDTEYRRRRADLNYYRALAAFRLAPFDHPPDRPLEILELGCGTGRLLLPLVRDGHKVTGLDYARPMLDRCAARLARLPAAVAARATLERGDFRDFSLGRRFPLVLCPFNAMMHLYTRPDVERFLACVRRHLAPGGVFAFDVMNPDLEWLCRDPSRRWARTRFKDPHTGRTLYYSTNHVYDAATQINHIRLYYDEAPEAGGPVPRRRGGDLTSAGGLPPTVKSRVVHLAQRQFFPEELSALLHYNGFIVDARCGGFVEEPFERESDSQVCRCSIQGGARR